jgi:glycosyltransferase involved in cell wall biosynthesis
VRIVLVADGDLPRYPDCSRDPDVLTAGLRSLGHAVTVLRITNATWPMAPPAPVHQLTESILPAVPAHLPADPSLVPAADVVVSLGRAAPPVAAVLADATGSPLVVSLPTDLLVPAPAVPTGYSRLVCRHLPAACLLVDFPRHLDAAEQLGADLHKVFVVPPGMILATPATAPCQAPLRVLCDASRTSLVDQQFLARVLVRLTTERARTVNTIIITSPSDVTSSAQTTALWAGRNTPAAVVHPVDGAAAAELYRSCDVVVVPGSDGDATVTTLRAMAAARAVLASDSAHIRDVASSVRHGVLARPGQEKEWTEKLDYILSEAPLRSHLGRNARARVENGFSLSHTLRCIDDRLAAVTAAWRYVAPQVPSANPLRPL